MTRWIVYAGSPTLLYDLIFASKHSLVFQSLHSTNEKGTGELTNGDGFGVGWYNNDLLPTISSYGRAREIPALYRSIEPAWHDRNMQDLAQHIKSGLVFAHVRAASPGINSVQQTNCHPFRYNNWLWMHNGHIRHFHAIKRDMLYRIDPKYFNSIEGTTDSEAFFYLALTFGLEQNPPMAVARAVGWIIQHSQAAGAEFPLQMTLATTDGKRVWAFRFSSEGTSRSLFYSTDKDALTKIYPENERIRQFSDDARFIVSEPLGDIPEVWNAVPESSCVLVDGKSLEITPFAPVFDDQCAALDV